MNLHSVYKAYKRDPIIISDCPLTFKNIEFYLQVLLPAYRFTIIFQRTSANISEVLPSILLILDTWKKLSEKKKFKTICKVLIESFTEKFHYELNSNVYFTSSLLNVTKLPLWYWKQFSSSYVSRAQNIILEIMEKYCLKETIEPNIIESKEKF